MRALHYVILEGKSLHEQNVQYLVTSLKSLIFFGTPFHHSSKQLAISYDSASFSSDSDAEDVQDR